MISVSLIGAELLLSTSNPNETVLSKYWPGWSGGGGGACGCGGGGDGGGDGGDAGGDGGGDGGGRVGGSGGGLGKSRTVHDESAPKQTRCSWPCGDVTSAPPQSLSRHETSSRFSPPSVCSR